MTAPAARPDGGLLSSRAAGLFLPLFALAAGGLREPWAFAAASVFVWGALAAAKPNLNLIPGGRWWLAWLAWSCLSAALSAEPWRALDDLSRRAAALGIFLLACGGRDAFLDAIWKNILLAAILALEGCALLISVPGYPHTGVLYPYYNYTAALAGAGAALGLALACEEKNGTRAFGACAALLSWIWLFWAGSRGGLLAGGAASFVVLLLSSRRRLAGIFLGAGASALVLLFALNAPVLKLDHLSANLRPKLWSAAAAAANESPVLGEGPGQFDRAFLRHNFPASPGQAPTRFGTVSRHAHSEFLQEAAETGWPGLLLYLLALAAALRAGLRRAPRHTGALAVCAALLLHSLFDNIFNLPGLEWLFFACLGSAASTGETGSRVPRAWILAGMLLTAVGLWPLWTVERAKARGDENSLLRALKIAPRSHALWADIARARLRAKDRRGAMEALVRASHLHPTEAAYPLMIALIARDAGKREIVLRQTARVLALEPQAPQARLLRAQALLESGLREEAKIELALFLNAVRPPEEIAAIKPQYRFLLGYEAGLHAALEKELGTP